jgi:hypothetical protein
MFQLGVLQDLQAGHLEWTVQHIDRNIYHRISVSSQLNRDRKDSRIRRNAFLCVIYQLHVGIFLHEHHRATMFLPQSTSRVIE